MAATKVVIKKYENRRLYDATNSRYVNLEEVAQYVQQGFDVQVVDAASGEDITRVVLTQIIAEGAKAPGSNFPLDILRQMIIASGRASQESALRYTRAMLDLYQSTYRAMAPALNPFDFLNQAQQAKGTEQAGDESRAKAAAGTPADAKETSSEDFDQMKKRIAELEKAVSSLHAGGATRAARRPRSRTVRTGRTPKKP